MASEPSDVNELRNLIERRRWGDDTKVYSRRIFRARRKRNNSCATTTTAAVLNSYDVNKGNEESNLLNEIASVKSLQTLVNQDGKSSQQDFPLLQEPTAERGRQEESASRNGIAVSDCMQVPQESREAVDTLAQQETREVVEPPRSTERVVEPESREMEVEIGCRQAIAVEPDNRKSLEVEPDNRESLEVEPQSREVLAVESESREVMAVEPESREVMAVEPASREVMVVEPASRVAMMVEAENRVATVVEPENSVAMVVEPENSVASVVELESKEATVGEPGSREEMEVEPESREEMEVEPGSREEMGVELERSEPVMVELESRELVAPENTEAVALDAESREAIELPESRENMEPRIRETVVEPETIETVVMQEDIETVDAVQEGREILEAELETRELVVVPESKELAVEAKSKETVREPESRETMGTLKHRETVGEPESRGTVREPQSRETELELVSRETDLDPESRETELDQESRETELDPGSRETELDPNSRQTEPDQESREPELDPESRETELEPESREIVMVESESREVEAVPPQNKEVVVLPENSEVVVPPVVNRNGVVEANGMIRLRQRQPQLMESQPHMPVVTRVEDRVRINMSGGRSTDEIRELRRELETELDQVRILYKKLESKELQVAAYNRSKLISNIGIVNGSNHNYPVSSFPGGGVGNFGGYSQPQYASSDIVDRRALMRVNSEVGSIGNQETRPFSRSLSVSVVENNHGVGDFVEREKRTPKANQFYRNSEFLLGKDRLPPESNKKLKPNGVGRKHGGEMDHGFGFGYDKQHKERVFRSCSSLLQRLMKHKFGWVFNVPVDAKKLGLHDYHDIIKHPMDLGTIKTRLSQNYYRSPKEFAEDVRLVFHNAMTYNPKGQDVHVMAETLLQIFEERWAVIQTEYNPDWRYQMYHDAGLPTPTSRKAPPAQFYTPAHAPAYAPITFPVTPIPQMRTLDRSESMTTPADPKLKPSNFSHVGRAPVLKKPKAKDLNKRDMTYEEKQKLSTNLQSLPSEKLDAIVQIIKKRNSTLSQHDDEIEVDIDSVDAETLWELDRFVTNYKKNLSKNKRKAEIALQARTLAAQTIPATNIAPAVVDVQKESGIDQNNAPPVQVEKQGDNVCRSSSSSSSSSDSGSSSSDSDSDSSSAYGSDAGRSPGA